MRILNLKRRFVAISLIVIIGTVLFLNNTGILAEIMPTPPPVPTILSVLTPAPDNSGSSPITPPSSAALPSYLMTNPAFAGKVLHWKQTSYAFTLQSPDLSNGMALNVDVWMRVGDDGVPITVHALTTFPDGTFNQEVVYTSDDSTFVMSASYLSKPPDKANNCIENNSSYPTVLRRSLLPPFVDVTLLPRFGFDQSKGEGLVLGPPATESLSGVQPLKRYGSGPIIQHWISRQLVDGTTNFKALDIGEDKRVLSSQARLINIKGETLNETWIVYGALEVYDPTIVPISVFSLSKQASEACHG